MGTLALGIAGPCLVGFGVFATGMINPKPGKSTAMAFIVGIMIVASFAITAGLVAREKGRSLWYALAGWIAPLLPIVLLLPYTKKRRAELMGIEQSTRESHEAHGVAALPARSAEGTHPDSITLGDANQFLRYRAASREKVDAQAALMDALLTRPDAPPVKAVLLRAADPTHEFPWLIAKSGTQKNIADMRAYASFEATFRSLFGDQPFSIVWADHIAENCPGPGEAVTPLGRERYAQIAQDIREGKYVVDRFLGATKS